MSITDRFARGCAALALAVGLTGCFGAHGVDDAPACCRGGVFEVEADGVAPFTLELDDCERLMGCWIDGEPRGCYLGHGALFVPLEASEPLVLDYTSCLGDQSVSRGPAPGGWRLTRIE